MRLNGEAEWQDLVGPALRSFFKLAEVWELREHEQMKLLGITDRATLHTWGSGTYVEARPETVERISYMLGIFKAINILLPDQTQADCWIRSSNAGQPFGGRSALDRITDGDVADLRIVRQYLEAQLG
jgi:hypothetical protein